MDNKKEFKREIGGFVLSWEEATKENGNLPWLVIKSMSGQWEVKLRGDSVTTMMWRNMLDDNPKIYDEYMHGQLRIMQMVNTNIYDAVSEFYIQLLTIGNAHLVSNGGKDAEDFNKKRLEIAQDLLNLTMNYEPKLNEISDKEDKKIIDRMRTVQVNTDLVNDELKETKD